MVLTVNMQLPTEEFEGLLYVKSLLSTGASLCGRIHYTMYAFNNNYAIVCKSMWVKPSTHSQKTVLVFF